MLLTAFKANQQTDNKQGVDARKLERQDLNIIKRNRQHVYRKEKISDSLHLPHLLYVHKPKNH